MCSLARLRAALLLLCCLSSSATLVSQQNGPPRSGPPPGAAGGNPQPGVMNGAPGGMGNPGDITRGSPMPGSEPDQQGLSGARGGLQIGPPGRWWDDKHYVKSLGLRPEQQKKMDSIFDQNRAALLRNYEGLRQEEQRMQTLVNAPALDESALFTQIDRIAQARAALEKANTHLLLQLRAEMTPEQIARLNEHH
jgi:Spy/CpxP family protein refolding chaperone